MARLSNLRNTPYAQAARAKPKPVASTDGPLTHGLPPGLTPEQWRQWQQNWGRPGAFNPKPGGLGAADSGTHPGVGQGPAQPAVPSQGTSTDPNYTSNVPFVKPDYTPYEAAYGNTQLGVAGSAAQLGHDYGFQVTPGSFDANGTYSGPTVGGEDASNPFSRQALLRKSFHNRQSGDNTSMAAGGQLYSGALQSVLENDRSGYEQDRSGLIGQLLSGLLGLGGQTIAANNERISGEAGALSQAQADAGPAIQAAAEAQQGNVQYHTDPGSGGYQAVLEGDRKTQGSVVAPVRPDDLTAFGQLKSEDSSAFLTYNAARMGAKLPLLSVADWFAAGKPTTTLGKPPASGGGGKGVGSMTAAQLAAWKQSWGKPGAFNPKKGSK